MNEEYLPVFVYGTLRRGEMNYSRYLEKGNARLEIPAVLDDYAMYSVGRGAFPAIVPHKGSKVIGEVIWLRESQEATVMMMLDHLEGYRPRNLRESMYVRKPELVELTTGGMAKAWVYVWNRGGAYLGNIIESGDWKARPREEPVIW